MEEKHILHCTSDFSSIKHLCVECTMFKTNSLVRETKG